MVNTLDEIKPSSVDFIYTLNVLEHIEDDLKALNEWRGLLKKDGKILIYVPAFQVLYSSMDKKVGHYRRYRKKDLINKLNLAGYKILKVQYVDIVGFFASLLYKFTNDGSGDLNPKTIEIYDRIIFPVSRVLDLIFGRWVGKNIYVIAES